MTKREIAALACKILALYALIGVLSSIGAIMPFLFPNVVLPPGMSLIGFVIGEFSYMALMLTIALFLWLQADLIAIRMVRDEEVSKEGSKMNASDIQAVAFSVVGLYILTHTIPRVAWLIVERSMSTPMPGMDAGWTSQAKASVAELAIKIVISLWLLFGSRGLVGLLRLTRETGSKNRKE